MLPSNNRQLTKGKLKNEGPLIMNSSERHWDINLQLELLSMLFSLLLLLFGVEVGERF